MQDLPQSGMASALLWHGQPLTGEVGEPLGELGVAEGVDVGVGVGVGVGVLEGSDGPGRPPWLMQAQWSWNTFKMPRSNPGSPQYASTQVLLLRYSSTIAAFLGWHRQA